MSRPESPPPAPADNDALLLQRYQARLDSASFRPLVERHLPLVWSTARRLAQGDAGMAEDITQIVFSDFARKAPVFPTGTIAAGWLHRHTCFTARKLVRTEFRRRSREHTAAQLHLDDPAMNPEPNTQWLEAAPWLDTALDSLSTADREALILRYYQKQDHRHIGTVMGISEDTARKRIARALEKLRTVLRRRGVVLTAALLIQFLSDHATAAVPVALAASLPGAVWRQATATGPITAVPASLLRRFWPAAAAVLLVTAGVWTAVSAGWFGSNIRPAHGLDFSSPTRAVEVSPKEITVQFTLVDLPARAIQSRLLTWQPQGTDSALFEESVRLARSQGEVLEYTATAFPGQMVTCGTSRTHPIIFSDWDPVKNQPEAKDTDNKELEKMVRMTPRLEESGALFLEWRLDYVTAEPETHAWPFSLEASGGDPERSSRMDDFFSCYSSGQSAELVPSMPQLLMSQHLPAAVMPDSLPEPRCVLLFVTLTPP